MPRLLHTLSVVSMLVAGTWPSQAQGFPTMPAPSPPSVPPPVDRPEPRRPPDHRTPIRLPSEPSIEELKDLLEVPEDSRVSQDPFYCGPHHLCGDSSPANPVVAPSELGEPGSPGLPGNVLTGDGRGGGSSADPFSFSFVVALLKDGQVRCSGVLIGDRQVLTAAHCLCDEKPEEIFLGSSIFVGDPSNMGYSSRHPLSTEAHFLDPDFCRKHGRLEEGELLDLAIVETRASLGLHKSFLIETHQIGDHPGRKTIVGFGASNHSNAGGVKRYATIDAKLCDSHNRERTGCIPGKEYVAENQIGNSTDTCKGDSGGPLLYLDLQHKLWLVGITSRKISQSRERYCGSGGVYVGLDQSRVRQWIERYTG